MAAVANFVKKDDRHNVEKPYLYHGPEKEGFPKSNLVYEESPLSLTDLRSVSDFEPTVESHGFAFIEHESKELPALIDESNSQAYAVEMAQVLKKLLNAKLVLPYMTRCRSAMEEEQKGQNRAPVGTEAHIDTTTFDAWARIKVLLTPGEQDLVLSGKYRARIMNLWRPMKNPVENFPLALLDASSTDYESDTVAIDQVTPMGTAETLYLKSKPTHKWYWKSNMTPDEAIIFTQYDTHPPEGKINQIGHCAFHNPAARPDAPPRRSIETRFTVIEPAPYAKPTTLTDPHPPETLKQPWRDFVDLPERPPVWKAGFAREDLKALEIAEVA